ncbi:hypothetical protein BSKO_05300 [Bryopsis sp. KO-2023]|nr:hypothetical protein BSKO_05300 [Bryopsis sp. KO-2023]
MTSGDQNNVEERFSCSYSKEIALVAATLALASIYMWYPQDDIQEWTQPLHLQRTHFNHHLVYAAEKSMVVCVVPKVASTVMLMLVKRMNGDPNWSSRVMQEIRNRHREEIRNADLENPNFIKLAMVRNPVDRVLSGYLNKMVSVRKYSLLPEGSWEEDKVAEPPTFEEFVDIIGSVPQQSLDKHFRPQSLLCETDTVSYTKFLDFEEREKGMKEFLESVDLWEDMGASGWGPNGTAPIFAEMENVKLVTSNIRPATVSVERDEKVQQYYTPEILNKVFRIYEMDFVAFEEFGWSRDISTYLNLSST